jgi:tRNA (guanine-N7-)-methyltransferase
VNTAVIENPAGKSAVQKPTLFFVPSTIVEPIRTESIFPSVQPLEVELGCGDGAFLLRYAALHPERNFLAVERLLGRIRKLDRKGPRAGLKNLRLLRLEASYALEYLLPDACAQAIHVYFPDPWPKRRHHRRRLINARFMELAAKALAPGGILHLRTDDADYFEQMTTVGRAHPAFQEIAPPEDLISVCTDFEKLFMDQGLPIHRTAFQKKA